MKKEDLEMMSATITDAIETILITQDSAEKMDEILTRHNIAHTGAPDGTRLIELTAKMAQLRIFLMTDVADAMASKE